MRPESQRKEADDAKAQFTHPDGDHLTLLNVFHAFKANSNDSNWAWNNYLSHRALISADNVRLQLKRTMERFDLDLVSTAFEDRNYYTNIRKAIVCGYFMQAAHREGAKGNSYLTIKDAQVVSLHPSTGLDTSPEFVIYNEFALTTKNFLRTVTAVKPDWLLTYGGEYFNLRTFQDGPLKRALMYAAEKKASKASKKDENGDRKRSKKQR